MELFKLLGTIAIDNSGANAAIDDTTGKAEASESRMTAAFKKIGAAVVTYLAVDKIVSFGQACLDAAANVEATNSQFSQVFGDLESTASASLSGIADQAGITENRLKGSYTKIAAFAKTTGMSTADALSLADRAMIAVADSAAFYDRSLEETTESLQSFLKGNFENDAALGLSCTEVTRNAAAMELFGDEYKNLSEQQKQLTLLKMVEDANALSGAMGQAARESDTWSNQTGNLSQAFTDMKAKIGSYFLAPMIQVVKKIGEVVGAFTDKLDPAIETAKEVFGEMYNFLADTVFVGFEALWDSLQNLGAAFEPVIQFVKDLITEFINSEAPATILNTVVGAITDALGWLADKINIVAEFISPFIENITEYVASGEAARDITNFFVEALEFLKTTLEPIREKIQPFVDIVKEYVTSGEMMNDITSVASTLFENLSTAFKSLIDFIVPLIEDFYEYVASGEAVKDVMNALEEAVNWVYEAFIKVSDWCRNNKELIESIVIIVGSFATAWGLVNVAITAWNAICAVATTVTTAFSAAVAFLTSPVTLVVAAIGALIAIVALLVTHWDEVSVAATNAWNWIVGVFEDAANWFNSNIVEPISSFFGGMWESIATGAVEAWNSVTSAFGSVADWFEEVFSNAWQKVRDVFSAGGEIFTGITTGITEFFKTIVNGLIGGINDVIAVPFNAINDMLSGIKGVNILGVKPFDWITNFEVPQIPMLEEGGVLEKGQVGLLEGNGAEAVVPLEQNTGWLNEIAARLNGLTGAGDNALLSAILEELKELNAEQVDRFIEALERMSFKIDKREFARLVEGV